MTVDQNLRFQQNVAKSEIAVIVMGAISNAREDLLPLVPAVLAALATIGPGQMVEVKADM